MKKRIIELNGKDLLTEGRLDTIVERIEGNRFKTSHAALPREIEIRKSKDGGVEIDLPEGTKRFILLDA